MKLLTKEIKNRFKKIGSQKRSLDPIIVAKFFFPAGAATWFASEFDEKEGLFFGWACLTGSPQDGEWGYFSLEELESFVGQFNLKVERDKFFIEALSSEAIRDYFKSIGVSYG